MRPPSLFFFSLSLFEGTRFGSRIWADLTTKEGAPAVRWEGHVDGRACVGAFLSAFGGDTRDGQSSFAVCTQQALPDGGTDGSMAGMNGGASAASINSSVAASTAVAVAGVTTWDVCVQLWGGEEEGDEGGDEELFTLAARNADAREVVSYLAVHGSRTVDRHDDRTTYALLTSDPAKASIWKRGSTRGTIVLAGNVDWRPHGVGQYLSVYAGAMTGGKYGGTAGGGGRSGSGSGAGDRTQMLSLRVMVQPDISKASLWSFVL